LVLLNRCFRTPLAAVFTLVGMSAAGCSFVLDTESLSSEGTAGTAGAPGKCAKGAEGCADCLGKSCCDELTQCTSATLCAVALGRYQECRNTTPGPACFTTFTTNGGPRAASLASCGAVNCPGECN
jgi:hypothetical protein